MITVLVAIDTVYKQIIAIDLEKKGNTGPFAGRSLAAFARYVGHPKVIIQGTRSTHSWQSFTMHADGSSARE